MNRFTMKDVRWERSRRGWWKLNTDGSSMGNPGLAGGGGIVRDEMGSWVMGFSRNIGATSSFEAELWALRDGLSICVEKYYLAIEVELDAKAIIDILLNPNQANSFVYPPLEDCKHLASDIVCMRYKLCFTLGIVWVHLVPQISPPLGLQHVST